MQISSENLSIRALRTVATAIGQLHNRELQRRPGTDSGVNLITTDWRLFQA
ncbi:hypothetical protein D3C85_1918600 [compost metagenome]